MAELVGLIPAAGKGVRARPYTSLVPKGMLQIDGRPNLERIINLMRDDLGITRIYMTVGYRSDVIRHYFGDGSSFGVQLHYVENVELDRGLAWSVLLAGRQAAAPCCVMLSDECYIGSNHRELLIFPYDEVIATCTTMEVDDVRLIQRNYAVYKEGDRILKLVEKPEVVENNLLGLGTFLLMPTFFERLEEACGQKDYVEFVTFLNSLCQKGPGVGCFEMQGSYVNINDRDSLHLARYLERQRSFHTNSVGLLLYAEGSEEHLGFTIGRYKKNEWVDVVYVLIPHESMQEKAIETANAIVIRCPEGLNRYGERLLYGMDQMQDDILVLAEADYTFGAHDISKLLEYLKEADIVAGTRTTRQLIAQGSDMRGVVRLANIFLAKLIELLWWRREVRISDVACTFRAMWRDCYRDLRPELTGQGPEVLAEMVISALNQRKRLIEIPVNYYNRSKALYRTYRNRKTFLAILLMLCRKKVSKTPSF